MIFLSKNKVKERPLKNTKYEEIKFRHLAPDDSIDDPVIFDALDYALSQNSIHNIALTGNYGSGKSSVLASYIKKNKSKNKFLTISLATFTTDDSKKSDKHGNGDNQGQSDESENSLSDTIIQKIEKSILQQIFYRQPGHRFPYSRFSRIKILNVWRKIAIELIVICLLLFPLFVLNPSSWTNFEKSKENILLAVLFSVAFLLSLYIIISFAARIRLTKFSFQKAEFGLDEVKEESLLNKYLDEILYFFETTRYDVVIIEDLDRFKNTGIFVKLRELNTLLNNYVKIKRHIVFVYALRDEVFKDTSRTKFFEFIIPIIPVINNQNSGDKLLAAQEKNKNSALSEIDKDFLQDVGLYVDDMRLLTNCINEFKIYDKKVNFGDYTIAETPDTPAGICHNRNRIFAMILYKNLYPKDFANLSCNKGELYSIFQKKADIIKEKTTELENEIIPLQNEIEKIESQIDIDIQELRLIYIAKIFSKKPADTYIKENIQDFLSDEKFADLRNRTSLSSCLIVRNGYNTNMQSRSFSYNFSDIEQEINPDYTYDQREELLQNRREGRIRELQQQIKEKKSYIANAAQMPMAELLNEIPSERLLGDLEELNPDFIVFLLRNGYIDENYFDYISYFYPNALSLNDKNFLLLIKNHHAPLFDLPLNNIENAIKRVKDAEWQLSSILNYSLLNYLLDKSDRHLKNFVMALWNYKQANPNDSFLTNYVNNDKKQLVTFYTDLYSQCKNKQEWTEILFAHEERHVVYNFFINAPIEASNTECVNFLSKDVSLLHRSLEDEGAVAEKIKTLRLKFVLAEDTVNYPIYRILLDANAYKICQKNFNIILAEFDSGSAPIHDYYTRISNLPNKNVKDYVNQNIASFIKNVILPVGDDMSENEESFIEILNNSSLSADLKEDVIKKNNCVVSDITRIAILTENTDSDIFDAWDCLATCKKIAPVWQNIFKYFEHNDSTLNENLLLLLNDDTIVDALTKEKPLSDEEIDNETGDYDVVNNLYSCILKSDDLSLRNYSKLMDVCPCPDKNLSKYDISKDKMHFLITEKKISLTKENFAGVKSAYPDLIPVFVNVRFSSFVNTNCDLDISVEDMMSLLHSDDLTNEQKAKLLSADFSVWENATAKDTLAALGNIIIQIQFSAKSIVPITSIIDSIDDAQVLLKIIVLQQQYLQAGYISKTINNKMGESYKSLIKREGRKRNISFTSDAMAFCKVLKQKGLISSYKQNENKIVIQQKRK